MKRILFLLLAVIAMIVPSAAKTIEFMGIPVEGTISEFTKKLKAKGFTIDPDSKILPNGVRLFNGKVEGVPSLLTVHYGLKSKLVYEVISESSFSELNEKSQVDIKRLCTFFDSCYQDGIFINSSSNESNIEIEYVFVEDPSNIVESDIKGTASLKFETLKFIDIDPSYYIKIRIFNDEVLDDMVADDLPPILEVVDPTYIEIVPEDQVKNEVMHEIMSEDYPSVGAINVEGCDMDQFRIVQEQVVVKEPEPVIRPHEPEKIFLVVEQPAEFTGGQAAMMKWISEHIQYPAVAKENGVSGRVVVKFVVEKDGSITNQTVVKGVDKDLDKEALRLIKSMPNWKPGKNNGNPVRSYYNLPVTFRLPD